MNTTPSRSYSASPRSLLTKLFFGGSTSDVGPRPRRACPAPALVLDLKANPSVHAKQQCPGKEALPCHAMPSSSAQEELRTLDLGFDRTTVEQKYCVGEIIGAGGHGTVKVVIDKVTGQKYACKSVRKITAPEKQGNRNSTPAASPLGRDLGRMQALKREIAVLDKLKGALSSVELHEVLEDDVDVHIIMELCTGGELWHRIGDRHYSEKTVASYMRGVLRTLAIMHSHRIIHRDVKPGNFMLLNDQDTAPLKAIDFGLAVPYEPDSLPLSNLGFEGTPWYMAPEVLSSQVTPASDLWSVGVMAHQLLTGRFPFDDRKNPRSPVLSAIWKSVLTDQVDYDSPIWSEVSSEAKDFVRSLLDKDPSKRPTAKQALEHPFLKGGKASDRSVGKKLSRSVVQNIQRYAQEGLFKRTMLQSIVTEILTDSEEEEGWGAMGGERGAAAPLLPLPAAENLTSSSSSAAPTSSSGSTHVVPSAAGPVDVSRLQPLYTQVGLSPSAAVVEGRPLSAAVDAGRLGRKLKAMGFKVEEGEVRRLVDQVGAGGKLDYTTFTASQIDWRDLQQRYPDQWLALVRRTFQRLDSDNDGVIGADDIAHALQGSHLDEVDLQQAVQEALEAAAAAATAEATSSPGETFGAKQTTAAVSGKQQHVEGVLDLSAFSQMLAVGSLGSLDMYDDRLTSPRSHFLDAASIDQISAAMMMNGEGGGGGGGKNKVHPEGRQHGGFHFADLSSSSIRRP